MFTTFALDLRLARRKAGYTQRDCAHLLGITAAKLSLLEGGRRLPTMPQICTLSVIYGRTFESLFGALIDDARTALQSRILSLPMDTRVFAGTRNRAHSIERLARRLAEEQASHGSA